MDVIIAIPAVIILILMIMLKNSLQRITSLEIELDVKKNHYKRLLRGTLKYMTSNTPIRKEIEKELDKG